MALYANSTAETIAMGHAPAAHSKFLLHRAARNDPAAFPGLAFGLPALAQLDARDAFNRSLDDLILGLERRRHAPEPAPADAPARPAKRVRDLTS